MCVCVFVSVCACALATKTRAWPCFACVLFIEALDVDVASSPWVNEEHAWYTSWCCEGCFLLEDDLVLSNGFSFTCTEHTHSGSTRASIGNVQSQSTHFAKDMSAEIHHARCAKRHLHPSPLQLEQQQEQATNDTAKTKVMLVQTQAQASITRDSTLRVSLAAAAQRACWHKPRRFGESLGAAESSVRR